MGFRSLSVILLTGAFTGMVLGLQGMLMLQRVGSEAFVGPLVAIALVRELGPVLAALMVTGRAGSALAAEIGVMRITEQIDALTVMALNPMRYLVVPTLVAGVIALPLLAWVFDVVGIYGGYLVAVKLFGMSSGTYFGQIQAFLDTGDIWVGFWKALVVRARHHVGRLLQGLPRRPRRRGRGARHDRGGRAGVGPDPRARLLPGLGAAVTGTPAPAIRVEGLRKRFGSQEVLRGVDLEIAPSELMVVIGRSGGGKSVLLRHLLGLVRPDAGRVIIDGEDVASLHGRALDRIRERFGVVFQGGALFDSLDRARERRCSRSGSAAGFPRAELLPRAQEALAQVGLGEMGHKYPAEISGGMRKRVAIARALVTEPQVVFLDEPTTGLDPILVNSIHHLIVGLHRKFGFTAVMVSHEIPEIFQIADRVAMLHEGRIHAVGHAGGDPGLQRPGGASVHPRRGRGAGRLAASGSAKEARRPSWGDEWSSESGCSWSRESSRWRTCP